MSSEILAQRSATWSTTEWTVPSTILAIFHLKEMTRGIGL